jgi:hypothetical protein
MNVGNEHPLERGAHGEPLTCSVCDPSPGPGLQRAHTDASANLSLDVGDPLGRSLENGRSRWIEAAREERRSQ